MIKLFTCAGFIFLTLFASAFIIGFFDEDLYWDIAYYGCLIIALLFFIAAEILGKLEGISEKLDN